jgi:hypothetical protein
MGLALICTRAGVTRVVPGAGTPYWIDSCGRLGLDQPEADKIDWYAPDAGSLTFIETTATGEAADLLQALIDVGLEEAGVVDVGGSR